MRRGLKPHKFHISIPLTEAAAACPDEKGTETAARHGAELTNYAAAACPDEKGTETAVAGLSAQQAHNCCSRLPR